MKNAFEKSHKFLTMPMVSILALFGLLPTSGDAQYIDPAKAGSFSQPQIVQSPHNATSCTECHAVPSPGGSSKVTVLRAGDRALGRYKGIGVTGTMHTENESLFIERMPLTGLRVALNLLGDGYVEAVADQDLEAIAATQAKQTHGAIHGEYLRVTLPEKPDEEKAVGRFGWKAQHASLTSASAEALFGELGIENGLFPAQSENNFKTERPVTMSTEGYGSHQELDSLVEFIRSTEPIAPDSERSVTESSLAGSKIFDSVGCSICHVRTLKTAPAGTRLHGGLLTVSERIGGRDIHPFSDYLLHDVGTGDGIIQNIRPQDYDESTANKFRTAPLWGVRYRSWLMHDGKSITYHQAIMRHSGEASAVVHNYERLTPVEKENLRQFLDAL